VRTTSGPLGLRILIWLAGATTLVWMPMMIVVVMVFDAPGATERLEPYLMAGGLLLLLSLPTLCCTQASTALRRGRIGRAYALAALPFVQLGLLGIIMARK